MKTIIMRTEKSSRWTAMLVATVVAIITSIVVANATQTITTPNAAFISYNLATGASSAAITPATNRSVLVMGCVTMRGGAAGAFGVGQVNLLHSPGFSGGINHGFTWTGYNAWNSGAGTTFAGGDSTTGGIHIVYLEYGATEIQTASADTILIHNIGTAAAGNVTLIW